MSDVQEQGEGPTVNYEWLNPESKIQEVFDNVLEQLVAGAGGTPNADALLRLLDTGTFDEDKGESPASKALLIVLDDEIDRLARPRERLLQPIAGRPSSVPLEAVAGGSDTRDQGRGYRVADPIPFAMATLQEQVRQAHEFVSQEWESLFGSDEDMSEENLARRFSELLGALRRALAERLADLPSTWRRTFLLEISTALPRAWAACPKGAVLPGTTCERCGASADDPGEGEHRGVRAGTLRSYGGREGEGGRGLTKSIRDALPAELKPYTHLGQVFYLLRAGMYPLPNDLDSLEGRRFEVLREFFFGWSLVDLDGRSTANEALTKEFLAHLAQLAARSEDEDELGPALIPEPRIALLIEDVVLPFLHESLSARPGLPGERAVLAEGAGQPQLLALWQALLLGLPQPLALAAALSERALRDGPGVRDDVAQAAKMTRRALHELETGLRFADSPDELQRLEAALALPGGLSGLRPPDLFALWGLDADAP